MKKRNMYIGVIAFLAQFALILDSKTALAGATDGIILCIRTVIPALFPFFLLSATINSIFWGRPIYLLRPLGQLLHLPKGTEALLISSFFGGYPVGAQAVSDLYRRGCITKTHAEQLLPYCNNPGPSFLFGMVALLFPDKHTVWILWCIIVLSAFLTASILPPAVSQAKEASSPNPSPVNTMQSAVKAMGCVCGWILIFRVLIAFLSRWFLWRFPAPVQMLLIGLLELTNGCYELSQLSNPNLCFLICGCILSFGGLCVTMQTSSVIAELSMKQYFLGKLIQTGITLVLCISYLCKLWFVPILCLAYICVPRKHKNSSRFPRKAIV